MTDPQTPQPLPTVKPLAQDAVTLLETVIDTGESTVETTIIAAEPWMGIPGIKQVWEAALDFLVKLLERPLAVYAGRVIIDADEYLALRAALQAQAALDAAKQTGDPHAISQASQSVDTAVAGAIQYVGATHSERLL